MPALIALAIITAAASITTGIVQRNQLNKNQNLLNDAQEAARKDQIRNEVGVAQQRTNTALAGAGSRPTNASDASFGAQSMLGALPAQQSSSGDF